MTITVHPGDFIKRNYIEELGLTATELAEALEVSGSTLSRLLNEKIDLSPVLAIKLSEVLGRSAVSWLNMQANHTLARCQADMSGWKPKLRMSDAGVWTSRTAGKGPAKKKPAARGKEPDVVQVKNPRSNRYIKIDRSAGKILSHKKSEGPYKDVPIARKRR